MIDTTITQSHYANASIYDPGTLAPPPLTTMAPGGQTFVFVKEIVVLIITTFGSSKCIFVIYILFHVFQYQSLVVQTGPK